MNFEKKLYSNIPNENPVIPVNKQIKDNFIEPRIYLSDNATVLYAEIDYQFWYY